MQFIAHKVHIESAKHRIISSGIERKTTFKIDSMENFKGYHAEWNLGCPGGWEYQRMAQERGKLCWRRVKKITGIEIQLDFEHPILNPVPLFIDMLLRAHRIKFQRE